MSNPVGVVSERFYRGLWGVLTRWFHVPRQPPALPPTSGEIVDAFKPSRGFLKYLKFQFWIKALVLAAMILTGSIGTTVAAPMWGAALGSLLILLDVAGTMVAYLAIHLRYDTTWYVMSGRSIRIRRGIWVIHETTITYENIQNVTVRQGPLQRWFGIANVLIETAGGGAAQAQGHQGGAGQAAHRGLIEGVAEAHTIRDRLVARLRHSRSAGLGDEQEEHQRRPGWTAEQLDLLREIRDAAVQLREVQTI